MFLTSFAVHLRSLAEYMISAGEAAVENRKCISEAAITTEIQVQLVRLTRVQ